MYLPRVELQQWRGQVYCPYCIMDIRTEEKADEEIISEHARKKLEKPDEDIPPDDYAPGVGIKENEKSSEEKTRIYECDKCKSGLDIVYVVSDHQFCEYCFRQQVKQWKDNDIQPPPYLKFKIRESPGLFSRFIDFLKRKITEEWERRNKDEKNK